MKPLPSLNDIALKCFLALMSNPSREQSCERTADTAFNYAWAFWRKAQGETVKHVPRTMRDIRRRGLLEALEANHWSITKTATELRLRRTSVQKSMKRLGIESPHMKAPE